MTKGSPAIGVPVDCGPNRFVQVERRALEQWALLTARHPRASVLLQLLTARMGHQNVLVCSQKLLARMMGASTDTVGRAIKVLVDEQWIQVVKLNGPGSVCAYAVNASVAWAQSRDQIGRLAVFNAAVLACEGDQDAATLSHRELRKVPVMLPGETQLPTGPGLDPPSQMLLSGMEPELPAIGAGDTPAPVTPTAKRRRRS